MENTGSIVERKAHQAHQTVDEVAQGVSAKAGPAIDRAAQAAHRTVDKVAGAAAPAAEWVAQSADELKRQQDEFVVACRGYVRVTAPDGGGGGLDSGLPDRAAGTLMGFVRGGGVSAPGHAVDPASDPRMRAACGWRIESLVSLRQHLP